MKKTDLKAELTKLVGFKSVTADAVACTKLIEYQKTLYESAGMKVESGVINKHPYLVASHNNPKSFDILLQAHTDVVPAVDSMFNARVVGDKLIGRGTYDMLFAVACFNKLVLEEDLSDLSIGIMLTTDEEIGGYDGVGALIDKYDAKVCVLPDAGTNKEICYEAKGVLQLALHIPGVSGHGARPWLTDSPILKVAKVVKVIREVFPNTDNEDTTCSFTQIHGGQANNQVPSSVDLIIDIRFKPADQPFDLREKVEKAMKIIGVTVDLADPIGESYATDLENPAVAKYLSLYETMASTKLGTMRAPGSSDARFLTPKGIPVIMTRPDGGGLHGDDEWISITSLIEYYEILKSYVLSFREV